MLKYKYTIQNEFGTTTDIETLNVSDVPNGVNYETIEFDPNEGEAERLAQEKLQMIKAEIASLESQITNRRMREAMVSGDYGFISDIEQQIEAKRNELKGLIVYQHQM